jgi:hypothetical protein
MRKIERELRKAFPRAQLETTGDNHLRLEFPGGNLVIASNTPGDVHFLNNVRREVRKRMRTPAHKRSVQQ